MSIIKRLSAVLTIMLVLLGGVVARAQTPGGAGIGDPYFPNLGNSGYDVQHYAIDIALDDALTHFSATTTIDARATQDLSAFNLDFQAQQVDQVRVNDAPATFDRDGGELTITPEVPVSADDAFTVVIDYQGSPLPRADQETFAALGWLALADGVAALGEPAGSSQWYPVNEHPLDKAPYTFRITVAAPLVAVANGVLESVTEVDDNRIFTWHMDQPMASYLALLVIGDLAERAGQSPQGTPIRNYFPTRFADDGEAAFAVQGEMIDYFSSIFGAYPFDAYGALVLDARVGFSLETQSMTVFAPGVMTAALQGIPSRGEGTIAHELAHQWFGDSVSLKSWRDIWLNESFATYASWLWFEHTSGRAVLNSIAEDVHDELSRSRRVAITGDPTAQRLFDTGGVYYRGALALHALRITVGDEAFFDILATYYDTYKYGNASTDDFIAVSEAVTGQSLEGFFEAWLFGRTLPELPAPAV